MTMSDDITKEIGKLRVNIWNAVSRIEVAEEATEIEAKKLVRTVEKNGIESLSGEDWRFLSKEVAVFNQKSVHYNIIELGKILEESLRPDELRDAYKALLSVVCSIQALTRSILTPFAEIRHHARSSHGGKNSGKARKPKWHKPALELLQKIRAERRGGSPPDMADEIRNELILAGFKVPKVDTVTRWLREQ
jgi:hypothetical protein